MLQRENQTAVDAYDLSTLSSTVGQIKRGVVEGLNGDLREEVNTLSENPTRDDIKKWISQINSEHAEDFLRAVDREERKQILLGLKNRIKYIPDIEINSGQSIEDQLDLITSQLSLSELSYYDSHFNFSNNSVELFKIEEIGGPAGMVSDADTVSRAKERFGKAVSETEHVSDVFADAIKRTPAPVLGALTNDPVPRIAWIEDTEHIYVEYWSLKDSESVFDGETGKSVEFRPRVKTGVRIHLDTGIIEVSGGKSNQDHKTLILKSITGLCSDSQVATDGGQIINEVDTLYEYEKHLHESDIWGVINNIGVISTVEAFKGHTADVRLSAVKNRNVQNSKKYEKVQDQSIRLANVTVFVDDPHGRCDFVPPEFVEDNLDFDEDATREEIETKIEEEGTYPDVEHITITLNEENNTFRIRKERWSPEARKKVFHLVSSELGW